MISPFALQVLVDAMVVEAEDVMAVVMGVAMEVVSVVVVAEAVILGVTLVVIMEVTEPGIMADIRFVLNEI